MEIKERDTKGIRRMKIAIGTVLLALQFGAELLRWPFALCASGLRGMSDYIGRTFDSMAEGL